MAGRVAIRFPSHPIFFVFFTLSPTYSPTDVKDETIQLTDQEMHFKGKSNNKDYEVNIAFFKKVDSEGSTYKVLPRSVQMLLQKAKDDQDEFWPRLLEDKALEKNQVKIDWDRYVDEDEEEEGFDTSNLDGGMGMGGPPGMGGMPPGMDMEALMKQMVGFPGVLGGRMDDTGYNGVGSSTHCVSTATTTMNRSR